MDNEKVMTGPLNAMQSVALSEQTTQQTQQPPVELFTFSSMQAKLKKLIDSWIDEKRKTEVRRKMRSLDIDIDALRNNGDLKEDETFIAVRVINTNIRQEEPPYVAYLTQSPRLAIFKCLNKPNVTATAIETDYTRGMTYNEWQKPHMKCRDGASLHGWDSVEVEYHEDRPCKTNVDHVGHDKLLFNLKSRDLQANKYICREYDVTLLKLEELRKKPGFNIPQVDKLIAHINKDNSDIEKPLVIYKYMCKHEGFVYVGWFSLDASDDWLSNPVPLFRGRTRMELKLVTKSVVDPMTGLPIDTSVQEPVETKIYESRYPYHILRYQETEEACIADTKGRAFLDGPKQEAQTCLFSNFVNQTCRSSNVYCSTKHPSGNGAAPKRLDIELVTGAMYSEPLEFFSPPNPSYDIIRGAQALDVQTQSESGQVAFAVQNRQQDSRKTAKEVEVAGQKEGLLTSVQVVQFSTYLRGCHTDSWSIIQSQALTNKIPFAQKLDPTTGQYTNDIELLSLDYDVRAAGDVDVIERAEKIERRKSLWPIISATPLAGEFLQDLVKEMLPDDSERYINVLKTAEQQQARDQILLNLIRQSAATGEAFKPEDVAQLEQSLGGQPSAVNNQQQVP